MTEAAGAAAAAGTGDNGAAGAASAAIASAAGAGDAQSWINSIPENARDYVNNKGWKSQTDLLTGYQNLESKLGANRVVIPKDGDTASEAEFRKALGVPEAADKYDIKLPEGATVDKAFLDTAKGWFHEAGLTPKQANALASKWNEHGAKLTADAEAAWKQQNEADFENVKKEWGKEADANFAAAQKALRAGAKAAGIDPKVASEAMEQALGAAGYAKFLAFFGKGLGEHHFVNGEGVTGSHFTPEAARARMDQLKKDSGWFAKFQANDIAAVTEWKNLLAAASAGMS